MTITTKHILSAAMIAGLSLSGVMAQAQSSGTAEQDAPIVTPDPEASAPEDQGSVQTTTEQPPETEGEPAGGQPAEGVTNDPATGNDPAADAIVDTTEDEPAAQATDDAATEEPAAGTTEETAAEEPAAEATDETAEQAPAAEAADEAVTEEPAAEATEETAEEQPAEETSEGAVAEAAEGNPEAEEAAETAPTEEQPAEQVGEIVGGTEGETEATTETTHGVSEEEHEVGVAEGDDHGDDSHATPHIENIDFSFDGPFGSYDVNQLQRGLQIYTEVCAACHGLEYVALRTLGDEGGPSLPEEQVIEYAKQWNVYDAELDDTRPGTPVDHFPPSNLENAPDLSLMAKKRAAFHGPYGLGINQFLMGTGGPEYITAILTSYTGETREQAGTTFYQNTAFPGGWIAMAPPLADGQVEFADEHANDMHHLAEDVSAFLMWTAEPKLGARKTAGFAGVIFLTLLSVLLYLTNKRLWGPVKHRHKD
jgi:ubiquinol-cytochrome c reductase cytochrome c1 subunit